MNFLGLHHYLQFSLSSGYLTNVVDNFSTNSLPYPICKPMRLHRKGRHNITNYDFKKFNNSSELPKNLNCPDEVFHQDFTAEHLLIPKYLYNYCNEILEGSYPYPSDFNPFYSTNNLDCFNWDNEEYFIRLNDKNQLIVTNLENKFRLKFNNLEGEIRGFHMYDNKQILLRTESGWSLWQFDDITSNANPLIAKNHPKLLESKKVNNNIGLITDDLQLHLYNLNTGNTLKLTRGFQFDSNQTELGVIDHNSLKLFDLKTNEFVAKFDSTLADCNKYCNFKFADESIYIVTRHYLLRTDRRQLGQFEYCTHMIRQSPCYIDVLGDYLAISSQIIPEIVVFPRGNLPTQFPNLTTTLKQTNFKYNLKNFDLIKTRISSPITGMKFVKNNDKFSLFYCTFIGDVFEQQITGDKFISNKEILEKFRDWCKHLPTGKQKITITNLVNLSERFLELQKLKIKEDNDHERDNKANDLINKFKYRYFSKNMSSLAANFALGWEIDDEVDLDVDLVPEVGSLEKVTTWIESNYFK